SFLFSSRRRHTRSTRDWSSDVCSSDLHTLAGGRVVDPFPPRRGRRLPARLAALEAAAEADPRRALIRLLEAGGLVDLPHFALVRSEERRVGKESRWRGSRCRWTET